MHLMVIEAFSVDTVILSQAVPIDCLLPDSTYTGEVRHYTQLFYVISFFLHFSKSVEKFALIQSFEVRYLFSSKISSAMNWLTNKFVFLYLSTL